MSPKKKHKTIKKPLKPRRVISPTDREKALQWQKDANLLDNLAMSMALENDVEAATEMLRPIIGDPSLRVTEIHTQAYIPPVGPNARTVIFDALATDEHGGAIDIEVQKASAYFSKERALYHGCSLVHAKALNKNEVFPKFRRCEVVFFCDGDFIHSKIPVSHIRPYLEIGEPEMEQLSHLLEIHIVNVRSERARGELLKLFSDLKEKDPDKMSLSSLAIALGRVKNKSMNEREIQWVVDHMSREQVEEMLRREETARQQGIAEGIEKGIAEGIEKGIEKGIAEGKASAVAELLRKGAISRDDARSFLNVDDAELDRLLKKC